MLGKQGNCSGGQVEREVSAEYNVVFLSNLFTGKGKGARSRLP